MKALLVIDIQKSYITKYETDKANKKSKKEDILKSAEGHILQKAELRGRYQRSHR